MWVVHNFGISMPTLTDKKIWSKVLMVYDIGKIKTLENKYHQYT